MAKLWMLFGRRKPRATEQDEYVEFVPMLPMHEAGSTTLTPEQEKRIVEIVFSAMYKAITEQAKRTGLQARGEKGE